MLIRQKKAVASQNFVSSNLIFYSFLGVDLVLVYGLYLLVQLPHQTIIHLIATFFECLSSLPDFFGLYSIFEITSLF